jgi:membrane protease YdiL (CAAX protease family)
MLYLNSQNIPELAGLNFAQRMAVVRTAADNLPAPIKITLNIIKLLILVPLFLLIADADGWAIALYIVLLLIAYPLIIRPLTFALCRKDFIRVRQKLFPA